MIGAILAPPLIVALNQWFGWQTAFLVPSFFGVVWVICWRRIYRFRASEERGAPGSQSAPAVGAFRLFPSDGNNTGYQTEFKKAWRTTLRKASVPYFRLYG